MTNIPLSQMFLSTLVALGIFTPAWAQEKSPKIPETNQKILKFVRQSQGKQVGNGECWTLASFATNQARAKRPGQDGLKLYEYGRLLKKGEPVLPGDIVQFNQAKFVSPNGFFQVLPMHTAIVDHVKGSQLRMWHQNFNGRRTVHSLTIDRSHLKQGLMLIYRPQPRSR